MDTRRFTIIQIERNDFNETWETNAVKHELNQELSENDDFNESGKQDECSIDETYFMGHKNPTDGHQEQNEKKFDWKSLNPEEIHHSEYSQKVSTSKCDTVQFKSEDDIDISYKDIKLETGEEKTSKLFKFCVMCYQSFDRETDIFKTASFIYECSCQTYNEPLFFHICGEDMTHDVTPAPYGFSTDSELQLEVQDEAISGDEVTKEQGTCALPRSLSKRHIMENDNKVQRKLCSKPLEINLNEEHQMGVTAEKKIQCKCFSRFFSFGQLKIHQRNHAKEKPLQCKTIHLKVHERSHTGKIPFQCKICSKAFSNSSDLRTHKRIHTGEKPFHCKVCSKSFSQAGNLKVHKMIHTGEKPFQCKICSKAFSNSTDLRTHKRIHTGEKPFHCKVCSKSFSQACNLTVHERVHTSEKLFHCKMCSKSFSHTGSLKVHERNHFDEKQFNCKVCSKSFNRAGKLKVHERSHTGEKPFNCKVCSKSFSQAGNLKVHETIHTGK